MSERTQILFLDVDGVLNSEASFIYWHDTLGPFDGRSKLWCPICTNNLRRLFELAPSTVKVVLSSDWRLGLDTLAEIKALFDARGVDSSRVIGRTAFFPGHPRGREIKSWIFNHGQRWDISSWAILDDDRDMEELTPQLVKTDFRVGLTLPHVDAALKLMRQVLVGPGWWSPAERKEEHGTTQTQKQEV